MGGGSAPERGEREKEGWHGLRLGSEKDSLSDVHTVHTISQGERLSDRANLSSPYIALQKRLLLQASRMHRN